MVEVMVTSEQVSAVVRTTAATEKEDQTGQEGDQQAAANDGTHDNAYEHADAQHYVLDLLKVTSPC